MSGDVRCAGIDGCDVTLRLVGMFWHSRRVVVVGSRQIICKRPIPEIADVVPFSDANLDDARTQAPDFNGDRQEIERLGHESWDAVTIRHRPGLTFAAVVLSGVPPPAENQARLVRADYNIRQRRKSRWWRRWSGETAVWRRPVLFLSFSWRAALCTANELLFNKSFASSRQPPSLRSVLTRLGSGRLLRRARQRRVAASRHVTDRVSSVLASPTSSVASYSSAGGQSWSSSSRRRPPPRPARGGLGLGHRRSSAALRGLGRRRCGLLRAAAAAWRGRLLDGRTAGHLASALSGERRLCPRGFARVRRAAKIPLGEDEFERAAVTRRTAISTFIKVPFSVEVSRPWSTRLAAHVTSSAHLRNAVQPEAEQLGSCIRNAIFARLTSTCVLFTWRRCSARAMDL